jgi:lysozyme family protein
MINQFNFNIAYQNTVLLHEGAYVFDKDDPGAETYRGISRVAWPNWTGWKIIDKEKRHAAGDKINNRLINDNRLDEKVKNFYFSKFWEKMKIEQIEGQKIRAFIFDSAVNCGIKTGARFLQKALNLINKNEVIFEDLKEDGIIGKKTLAAIDIIKNQDRQSVLLMTIIGERYSYYKEITKNNPKLEKFFHGWVLRTFDYIK